MTPRPKSKQESERNTRFAKGGSTKMFGAGSRTTTAATDAAGKQKPGSTAHKSPGPRQKYAKGGNPRPVGGLSFPAKGGATGPRSDE